MYGWLIAHYEALKDFATPALTLIGFCITIGLGVAGLKTFDRWRREKVEERRIEIAITALALAYESKIVFRSIRSSFATGEDWKEMPVIEGETEDSRQSRGSYFAIFKRLLDNKDYFERVWKLQPEVMAIFGEKMEDVFENVHDARATVLVASRALAFDDIPPNTEENRKLIMQLRNDIWGMHKETDRVQKRLDQFRKGIERVCKPIVDSQFQLDDYPGSP